MQRLVNSFKSNPKRLFIIDGLGALFSAFMLGIVLVRHQSLFGIPISVLYILASLPIVFAFLDLTFYIFGQKQLGRFLIIIALINIFYCFISLGFAFYHYNSLTTLGWAYILIEILIVLTLANIEFKVAIRYL